MLQLFNSHFLVFLINSYQPLTPIKNMISSALSTDPCLSIAILTLLNHKITNDYSFDSVVPPHSIIVTGHTSNVVVRAHNKRYLLPVLLSLF